MLLFEKIKCFISVCFEVLLQKLWMRNLPDLHSMPGDVEGRTVIVTGPTSGIGRETVAWFVRRRANVVLACRNLSKGNALLEELVEEAKANGVARPTVRVMQLDVSVLSSVWKFIEEWNAAGEPLHVLINNAGIFSMGAPRSETADEFESHLGTNHLAPFLLTLGLLPALRRSAESSGQPSRVVHVASKLHEAGHINLADPHLTAPGAYSPDAAYGQSKLAQVLFAAEMQRRLGPESGVACCALHPGEVLTGVVRTLPAWVQSVYRATFPLLLLTPQQGARCSVHCGSSPSAARHALEQGSTYFGSDCRPVRPSREATDAALASWLWSWSAASVGLPMSLDLPPAVAMQRQRLDRRQQ